MRRRLSIVLLFAFLTLLPVIAHAKGLFSAVLLTDSNTGTMLDITERETLNQFFIFQRGEVEAPAVETTGYELRRGGLVNGEFAPFDLLIYYPDAPGYIYYAGLLNREGELCTWCSEYDHRWYVITPEAEAELQDAISHIQQRLLFASFIQSLIATLTG